ncbi:glycine betaine/carnitine/choline transport ATP-binding protein OpuCA [Methanobrevibacter cuticularis]|uniref:Glycine betaine/carnitine/choline transport ATP-binding protein OpuCA n=1 Tax=Methanobrevibacter cuticularis TaxID=47311 RepID=A0A166DEE9_9EURY|nr:methyl coenzyme M reductase system, component A2 [Methanobrevibacter cuticularis]KZX15509.1 glycine betaine/carnitine/choline transport ATP-binding protein OpuCA [Methanobrevibacter cuticularis]
MSFIELKNINKTFNGVIVLKDINVEIDEGSVLGILGRSGAGKSVLINMLRGTKEYRPDSGQILFNVAICPECLRVEPPSKIGELCGCGCAFEGKVIDFWNIKTDRKEFSSIRKRIAIMLQRNFALYERESVIENILRAMGEGEYEENLYKALDLLETVQMSHRITHVARDLSGGEKQRVVLARQIAKDPMLFLADEPTGTLDPQTAEYLHQTLISSVKNQGITMVITSHWPEVMKQLADQVIWLEKGEIVEKGDSDEIVENFLATVPLPKKVTEHEYGGPIVKIEDIKKHYYSIDRGVIKAVDGVDLTIKQKEIFGIVGLSGSGKTTLSRMLIGLTDPSSGKIEVKLGDDWIDMREKGPLSRGRVIPYIGLLHQEYSLYPHRTVLGNLTDAISLDLPAEFAKMKAIHTLNAVGFDNEYAATILNKAPDELSGGERHRVAIAQVLIKEPTIVILDEPTGTMDPITRVQVTDSILKAREELGETFLIISHDMDFVIDVCDRTALMRGGKILKIGEPGEIVKELTPDEKKKMLD